ASGSVAVTVELTLWPRVAARLAMGLTDGGEFPPPMVLAARGVGVLIAKMVEPPSGKRPSLRSTLLVCEPKVMPSIKVNPLGRNNPFCSPSLESWKLACRSTLAEVFSLVSLSAQTNSHPPAGIVYWPLAGIWKPRGARRLSVSQ